MAESPASPLKSHPQKVPVETDMTADEHRVQLTDQDNISNNNQNNNNEKSINKVGDERVHGRAGETTTANIEEEFDEDESYRPKKLRYPSVNSVYDSATKLKKVIKGKKDNRVPGREGETTSVSIEEAYDEDESYRPKKLRHHSLNSILRVGDMAEVGYQGK